MKTASILLGAFLLLSTSGFAQETLFGRQHGTRVSGFGAPIVEISEINGQVGTSVGIGGGLMLDNFFIGIYGLGSLHGLAPNIDQDQPIDVFLTHGGIWTGFDIAPNQAVHITTQLRTGWGVALFNIEEDLSDYELDDQVWVVTPEIGVEINMTHFFKIALTGGYRWVHDIDAPGYSSEDFASPVGSIALKFGSFRNNKTRYSQRHKSYRRKW